MHEEDGHPKKCAQQTQHTHHVGTPCMSSQDGDGTSVFETPDATIPIFRCCCEKAVIERNVALHLKPRDAEQELPGAEQSLG
jgi:hypothetical protein